LGAAICEIPTALELSDLKIKQQEIMQKIKVYMTNSFPPQLRKPAWLEGGIKRLYLQGKEFI
jgi:hypothetical protein